MFAVLTSARKLWRRTALRIGAGVISVAALGSCEPIALGGLGSGPQINPGKPVPVALLVPRGSGNSGDAVLARSLENAARLAAEDVRGASIDLRVYDTAANAEVAANQARKAVADGAKIIIGPVYAEAANAVGVAVAGQNVNVLAFSNNPAIAGGNVFVLGPTFDNTARRLVRYAASQGRNRILVVHGNDVAGQTGRNAIQRATQGAAAQVVGTVQYELSPQGVADSVQQIAAEVAAQQANAIFMTSTTSGALPLYSSLLPGAGITPDIVQYIGLTRWDIPPQNLSLPGLQGGWYALPDPARSTAFRTRYESRFGAPPHPIGGLAFDGVAAVGALAAMGNRDALTRDVLIQPAGFQGVSGVFRLRANGTNDRALAVATVRDGQPVIIDAAPQSFGGF